MTQLLTIMCLQTAPMQVEECNGPMPSPKLQEPSTNHTGSGNVTFPLHIKTSPPIKRRFLSPLTCHAMSSDKRRLPSVRRTLQRLFSSTPSSGQTETQVRCYDQPHMLITAHHSSAVELAVTAQTGASVQYGSSSQPR